MDNINWRRVVLGGLISGVVLIALANIAVAFFLGPQQLRTMLLTLRPSSGGSAAPLFFAFVFIVLGVLMTALYAAIRPRFGAGPKTAMLAGFVVWLTGVWLSLCCFVVKCVALGEPMSLPAGPMLPCIYLAIMITSTVIGASVYKEPVAGRQS